MPYSSKEYETMNVNYLNKDFTSLKSSLIEYAKTYFPNSYRDFNETSPGMMLIEMSAYVGDVLSFYVDQQYQEMLLPLAQERRNLTTMADMFGYKVKPTTPAYADITITQTVAATDDNIDNILPKMSEAQIIDKGLVITSATDNEIVFETLDVVDFTISGTLDSVVVSNTDTNGLAVEYKISKKIRAISGETKTKSFTISSPEKFKRITLPENNVIEIIDCIDSSNNRWYEVDFLAQNKVPESVHFNDDARTESIHSTDQASAYVDLEGSIMDIPVPYTLDYINISKRFVVETNSDNTVSLVFGNGVLNQSVSGSLVQGFYQSEQAGIIIPGDETNFDKDLSPLLGSHSHASLGETPQNTTLTIIYRIGGGLSANVPTGDLTLLNNGVSRLVAGNSVTPAVTNLEPARGGQSEESLDEIRENTKGNFMSQRRCVTKEDYKARVLSLPAKFGAIAKVEVLRRGGGTGTNSELVNQMSTLTSLVENIFTNLSSIQISSNSIVGEENLNTIAELNNSIASRTSDALESSILSQEQMTGMSGGLQSDLASIEIHILSYDQNKNLVYSPLLIKNNLKNYLNEFRMITDEVSIMNAYIINFGVVFEVVAHKYANSQDVKLRCINKIKEYFNIDKMKTRQPIYSNDIIYELMGIDGVRAVNYLELTQQQLSDGTTTIFEQRLWNYNQDNPHTAHGGILSNADYNYEYDFNQFYTNNGDGVILPSVEPAVFELKNPNENIKGSVI